MGVRIKALIKLIVCLGGQFLLHNWQQITYTQLLQLIQSLNNRWRRGMEQYKVFGKSYRGGYECSNYYLDELIANVAYIGTPGKGILDADESTGTTGKRLSTINVENVENNRRALRELLFYTPGCLQYLSRLILFDKTLYQSTAAGKPFVDVLKEGGVLPRIKVDKGTTELAGTDGETTTQGLDGLAARCAKYYEAGSRFAKWCAVLKIGPLEAQHGYHRV